MASAQLTASIRTGTGKGAARSLRRSGHVPGVVYGHARQAQALAVSARDFARLLEHISAENTVVELTVDGHTLRTLIREIQRHPVKHREILHVDFQELVAGEKVVVRIPLVLVGTPEGVRVGGGILDQTLRDVEIELDPSTRIVLRAPWKKVTITPIDISVKTRFTTEMKAAIAKAATPVTDYLDKYSLPGYMWDEIAGAALIDPSIITGQKQLYMDIDTDHGASYGKTIFWSSEAKVPPYLHLANVQFDIDAEKFYKLYIDLMTRPLRK